MKGNIFIKRPVMAMSISIMILIVGAISFFTLPMEQFPDIAPQLFPLVHNIQVPMPMLLPML